MPTYGFDKWRWVGDGKRPVGDGLFEREPISGLGVEIHAQTRQKSSREMNGYEQNGMEWEVMELSEVMEWESGFSKYRCRDSNYRIRGWGRSNKSEIVFRKYGKFRVKLGIT